jgi:PAS domain S-box-containing protein
MHKLLAHLDAQRQRTLIGLLALLMFAAPGALVIRSDLRAIDQAERQAGGLEATWAVLELVRTTQLYRGLSNTVLAGHASLAERQTSARDDLAHASEGARDAVGRLGHALLSESLEHLMKRSSLLATTIEQRAVDGAQSFAMHTALIDEQLQLLEDIRAATGLILLTEPAGHYLEAAVLQHLPTLTESLGRLRGLGAGLLTRGQAQLSDRARLAAELGEARSKLRSAARALKLARAEDERRQTPLDTAILVATSAASRAVTLAEQRVVQDEHLDFPPAHYFDGMTLAVEAQYDLIKLSFTVLREQLDSARASTQRRLAFELVGAAMLGLFCAWTLAMVGRVQRSQEESDARARAIFDAAPNAMVIGDESGAVMLANRAAGQLYGRDGGTLTGMSLTALVAPESRAALQTSLVTLRATPGGTSSAPGRELTGQRLGGEVFPAEIACSSIGSGTGQRIVVVVRDLSERQRLERQLSQGQKMEAVGQLTGGIAHDFNNLLGVIVGNLDLLERSVANNPTAVQRVVTAQKAAMRGADLTRRLLAFSRKQHLEPAPLHLAVAVANVVEMAGGMLGTDIRITTAFSPDTPPVLVDAAALENAVLNLAVNARDAMPGGGLITIETTAVELDQDHPAVRTHDLQPGRYASLRVTDTGQGIPRETLDKVFDPFYTTKEAGKGTGLGLAMVYGFARQSGGHVSIYSEVGVGTVVAIVLPATTAEPVLTTQGPGHAEHRAPEGATALVVDDEPDLLVVAATHLQDLGYRVLAASDVPSAVRTLATEPRVDLLVTDVIMPGGMNGVKLSQLARRSRPDIRVVFTSGFPSQALAQRNGTRVDGLLINKPFSRRDFSVAVGRVMESELV